MSPKVTLVAKTEIDFESIRKYVNSVNGQPWSNRIEDELRDLNGPETLVEFMGRLCYRSWDEALNPNVTKVRTDSEEYLANIVKSGHGSVLEHVWFSFVISDVSRVVTHELVRHRVGTAFSQESMRYVRLNKIPFEYPEWVTANPELEADARELLEKAEAFQVKAAQAMRLDDFGTPFYTKKEVTSDMRRFAPDGVLTTIGFSANVRSIRDIVVKRTSIHAEREIREVFNQIARIVKAEVPAIMADLNPNEKGEWVSSYIL